MNTLEPLDPLASADPADAAALRRERLASLLVAARGGRRDALELIVTELSPLLWQVARAQGLDQETAQDAVQSTWLSLLRHLETIHDPAALTAWLVTTAKREAWRLSADRRSQMPVAEAAMASILDPLPAAEEDVLLNERQREVWQAVQRLPERCRELLRIVAFTHRPDYDQVAAALGIPRGSIGPTRGRCLAKLRDLVEI